LLETNDRGFDNVKNRFKESDAAAGA